MMAPHVFLPEHRKKGGPPLLEKMSEADQKYWKQQLLLEDTWSLEDFWSTNFRVPLVTNFSRRLTRLYRDELEKEGGRPDSFLNYPQRIWYFLLTTHSGSGIF